MSERSTQRQIDIMSDQLERLRKADAGTVSGTTTPTFSGLGGAGSYTYTAQSLTWMRVGNIINFSGRVAISAISGAPVGGMVILGLPVVSVGFGSCSWGYVSNLNITAGAYLTGLILSGDQGIRLMENFDNAGSVAYPAANFTNVNCDIIFNGWYPV
jgi:hypothetical protein